MTNRQLKLSLGVLALGFAAYIYFFPPTHTTTTVVEEKPVPKTDTITNNCFDCSIDNLHGETAAEFIDVTSRYKTMHHTLFSSFAKGGTMGSLSGTPYPQDATFEDARSCWFAADTLKKFLCLMERFAKDINIPSTNLGIRFYYATYPDDNDNKNNQYLTNINYKYNHTLYMVPTAYSETARTFVDFEPRQSSATSSFVTLVNAFPNDSLGFKTKNLFILGPTNNSEVQVTKSGGRTEKVSVNQGDLCPPNSGCDATINAINLRGTNY